MKKISSLIPGKVLLIWLLLLQMVNVSIDPARHLNVINGEITAAEDLRINTVESIYELVLEYVLKIDVPETQDSDEDALQKGFSPYCFFEHSDYDLSAIDLTIDHTQLYSDDLVEHFPSITSPPPKTIA